MTRDDSREPDDAEIRVGTEADDRQDADEVLADAAASADEDCPGRAGRPRRSLSRRAAVRSDGPPSRTGSTTARQASTSWATVG